MKDKYLMAKGKQLANELGVNGFGGSSGWLTNFKRRHDLVSRRKTSIRKLPENAHLIATNFISEVREFIATKNIKLSNILNMDQVPRYYEGTSVSTIIEKGARKVLLRRGGSSHKRFTATFTISGDGKMLKPHVLLSKITRTPPNMNPNVMLSLNRTGMWSSEILESYFKEIILKRPVTSMLHEPVLVLIDSYGPHIQLANSKKYEKHNVFIKLIPPNLTPILQPLDVAVNKSFQTHYNDLYNEYIGTAITTQAMQTKSGNVKTPSHGTISNWVWNWAKDFPTESIKNAFTCCGIGIGPLNTDTLHQPLGELYQEGFDAQLWEETNQNMATPDDVEPNVVDMYVPEDQLRSFYKCIHHKLRVPIEFDAWVKNYIKSLISIIESKYDEFDESDLQEIHKGELNDMEIVACAGKENLKIVVHVLDIMSNETEQIVYGHDNMTTVHLYKFDNYFSCEM